MSEQHWTRDTLAALNERFRHSSPREVLAWGFDAFGDGLVMATGFGPSGVVLAHQVSRLRPEATFFYLDTGLLFPETYALRDRLQDRLGITFTQVQGPSLAAQAHEHGDALWTHSPNTCCFIRKVQPLRRFLSDKDAWITGLRRDQSPARVRTEVLAWDAANGVVKLNPLAHWTSDDVWGYIHLNDLPYNALHDQGYPSIGCLPCTAPAALGDERSGRWAGRSKTECGIHVQTTIDLQQQAA